MNGFLIFDLRLSIFWCRLLSGDPESASESEI